MTGPDCEFTHIPDFLSQAEADGLWNTLMADSSRLSNEIRMGDGSVFHMPHGKTMFTDARFMNSSEFPVHHGKREIWLESLRPVKSRVEATTGYNFQVGVTLLYPDGAVGIDFHVDPPAFGSTRCIPSLSLGAERTFVLRRIDDPSECHETKLTHGSLVVMGTGCQKRYEHAVLLDPDVTEPRINITFRMIGNGTA